MIGALIAAAAAVIAILTPAAVAYRSGLARGRAEHSAACQPSPETAPTTREH